MSSRNFKQKLHRIAIQVITEWFNAIFDFKHLVQDVCNIYANFFTDLASSTSNEQSSASYFKHKHQLTKPWLGDSALQLNDVCRIN